jgi:hypothetical protein
MAFAPRKTAFSFKAAANEQIVALSGAARNAVDFDGRPARERMTDGRSGEVRAVIHQVQDDPAHKQYDVHGGCVSSRSTVPLAVQGHASASPAYLYEDRHTPRALPSLSTARPICKRDTLQRRWLPSPSANTSWTATSTRS